MKILLSLLSILFIVSCTSLPDKDAFFHMRKSFIIESIIEDMDEINYDESHTELDRDSRKLSFALQFHQEVSMLVAILKNQHATLPHKLSMYENKKEEYLRIMRLLDDNLAYLDKVIKHKDTTLVLPAIKNTQKSCAQCHILSKSEL